MAQGAEKSPASPIYYTGRRIVKMNDSNNAKTMYETMAVMFRTICAISGQRIISATQTPRRIRSRRKSLCRSPTTESLPPRQPRPPRRSRKRKRRTPSRSLSQIKSLLATVSCPCWISAWQKRAEGVQHDCI